MKFEILTTSPQKTKKAGEILAKEILKVKLRKKALILALVGDLGGGKTTFLQGLARGLGIRKKILSPTFVIMKRFRVSGLRFKYFYHLDCYRIEKAKEILDLGFKEVTSPPQNIVAIEWADRVRKIIPKDAIWIEFKFINTNSREIILNPRAKRKI